jgi:hypothetical protein
MAYLEHKFRSSLVTVTVFKHNRIWSWIISAPNKILKSFHRICFAKKRVTDVASFAGAGPGTGEGASRTKDDFREREPPETIIASPS